MKNMVHILYKGKEDSNSEIVIPLGWIILQLWKKYAIT